MRDCFGETSMLISVKKRGSNPGASFQVSLVELLSAALAFAGLCHFSDGVFHQHKSFATESVLMDVAIKVFDVTVSAEVLDGHHFRSLAGFFIEVHGRFRHKVLLVLSFYF